MRVNDFLLPRYVMNAICGCKYLIYIDFYVCECSHLFDFTSQSLTPSASKGDRFVAPFGYRSQNLPPLRAKQPTISTPSAFKSGCYQPEPLFGLIAAAYWDISLPSPLQVGKPENRKPAGERKSSPKSSTCGSNGLISSNDSHLPTRVSKTHMYQNHPPFASEKSPKIIHL